MKKLSLFDLGTVVWNQRTFNVIISSYRIEPTSHMTDILQYKDFLGIVHYSDKDEVFFGKQESVNDLVTFEGSTVKALKASFKETDDASIIRITNEAKYKFRNSSLCFVSLRCEHNSN